MSVYLLARCHMISTWVGQVRSNVQMMQLYISIQVVQVYIACMTQARTMSAKKPAQHNMPIVGIAAQNTQPDAMKIHRTNKI